MVEIVYILYSAASAGILGVFYRKSPRDWLLRWLLVSIFPIVGWLVPLFWPNSWFRRHNEMDVDILAELVQPEDIQTNDYSKVEVDKDLNVLSVEEALLVNNYAERRKIMLDVLKQDATAYMDVLQKAVSNEDSETSHYAVSAVMEVKRKLVMSLQELSVQYEANREDPHLLHTYANVISDYIRSGFLDERTLRKYKFTYVLVLGQLLTVSPDSEFAYREKAITELELDRYMEAEQTGLLYLERFVNSEEAYLLLIQVYYEMRSHKKLLETLDLLKRSPLRLSHRALTLVRFWSEGA